jgi:hypothetical protein
VAGSSIADRPLLPCLDVHPVYSNLQYVARSKMLRGEITPVAPRNGGPYNLRVASHLVLFLSEVMSIPMQNKKPRPLHLRSKTPKREGRGLKCVQPILRPKTLDARAEFPTNRAGESDQACAEESQGAGLRNRRHPCDGGRAVEIPEAFISVIVVAQTKNLIR